MARGRKNQFPDSLIRRIRDEANEGKTLRHIQYELARQEPPVKISLQYLSQLIRGLSRPECGGPTGGVRVANISTADIQRILELIAKRWYTSKREGIGKVSAREVAEQTNASSVAKAAYILRRCRTAFDKINKYLPLNRPTGACWIWSGSCITKPSGGKIPRIVLSQRLKPKQIYANVRRLVWILYGGTVPEGRRLTPACGNDLCLSPFCLGVFGKDFQNRRTNESEELNV